MMNGGCGEHRAIAAAAADDHIGALAQQLDVRVHAGHGDDAIGGLKLLQRQGRAPVEASDVFAVLDRGAQAILGDVRIVPTQFEWAELMFARQVANDAEIEIHATVGAGVTRGTDDHRHADAA